MPLFGFSLAVAQRVGQSAFRILSEFYISRSVSRPIVHRAGGMLLQAKKEFAICGDIRPDDVFFYYTTTFVPLSVDLSNDILPNAWIRGWMMWNFLVSSLTIGCTLILYDGSPLWDASLLWKLVDELGITIFGTSAKYLDQLSVFASNLLHFIF